MQLAQEPEPAVEAVTCAIDCSASPGIALDVAMVVILVAGGLMFSRWLDMLYVGLVGLVVFFAMPAVVHYIVFDTYYPFTLWDFAHPALWVMFAVIYVGMVAIAAAAHGVKRALLFAARRLIAARE